MRAVEPRLRGSDLCIASSISTFLTLPHLSIMKGLLIDPIQDVKALAEAIGLVEGQEMYKDLSTGEIQSVRPLSLSSVARERPTSESDLMVYLQAWKGISSRPTEE